MKAQIGSISSGTLLERDLIEAFAHELALLTQENRTEDEANLLRETSEYDPTDADYSDEKELVARLEDALEGHAPPYCYFGITEGGGAEFGFWPLMGCIEELPRITDMIHRGAMAGDSIEASPLADQARALDEDCVYVNDHGNVTIYGADGSILLEIV